MDESHKSLGVLTVQSNSMSTSVFTRCMPLWSRPRDAFMEIMFMEEVIAVEW